MRNLFLILVCCMFGCKSKQQAFVKYKTKYVVVVLIDGPRYSETFGDSTFQHIPNLHAIQKRGCTFSNFYNNGVTYTLNGHTAITTGINEAIDNNGVELPMQPGFLQLYLNKNKLPAHKGWIVASKDKIAVLANCQNATYHNLDTPMTNCGNLGLFTGYRDDQTTFTNAMQILKQEQPHIVFISLKEPDNMAHAGSWQGYLSGLKQSDAYTDSIFKFLCTNSFYAGKTAFFVTNDHGRHLDGVADGFVSHGDNCHGCKHIMLYANGPDFKSDFMISENYNQTDIHATVCELLGLEANGGRVIKEMFK